MSDPSSPELSKSELPSNGGVHESPRKALEKVGSEFEYWSGKLTETSLQMCYALIGANWVVFGSVGKILQNNWAKMSLLMVMLTLACNIVASWSLTESLRKRFEWAEGHSREWDRDFENAKGVRTPFPFTGFRENMGFCVRQIKGLFPLIAAILLVIGAIIS